MKAINRHNYYINTYANFKACVTPKREPDYISESGSRYWYGSNKKGEYVVRESNHWSSINNVEDCLSVASCWFNVVGKINNDTINSSPGGVVVKKRVKSTITGKCYFSDFRNRK